MIASNSLGYNGYDESDLQEMESAVSSNSLNGCRLLVFLKNYDNNSTLFEITRTNGVATRTTLKTYDNSMAATSVSRMSSVISDVASLAPAKSYGLVLWSHASGWALKLERSNTTKAMAANMPIVRNYGQDGTYEMRVNELADALPDNMFDFIYCDVCYFGCVEIAYQLRKKTHYFVASPTVILGDGMPYNQNIPAFCKDTPDLVAACQNTFTVRRIQIIHNCACRLLRSRCTCLYIGQNICQQQCSWEQWHTTIHPTFRWQMSVFRLPAIYEGNGDRRTGFRTQRRLQ